MIRKFWKTRERAPLVHDAFDEVYGMLERADGMFTSACQALFENAASDRDIALMDEDIDHGERIVRRMVFQHLSLNPSQDLTASLVLVSIVHDVERTGDYVKSLSYLAGWETSPSDTMNRCRSIADQIRPMFGHSLEALREGDEERARDVMARHVAVKAEANQFLQDLLGADEPAEGARDALVWNIGAQYLRRISAHLSNVASSVTNPFDRLGGSET